jgi:hypothetical protein
VQRPEFEVLVRVEEKPSTDDQVLVHRPVENSSLCALSGIKEPLRRPKEPSSSRSEREQHEAHRIDALVDGALLAEEVGDVKERDAARPCDFTFGSRSARALRGCIRLVGHACIEAKCLRLHESKSDHPSDQERRKAP